MPAKVSGKIRDGFAGQRMIVLPRPVAQKALSGPGDLDLLPMDIGYFPQAMGHEVIRPKGVGQMIVILCVRGEGWIETDGNRREIKAGEALVIGPNCPHAYGAAGPRPWTIYWLHAA